jgi:hypothetical protein
MSPKAELARRVLDSLAQKELVPTDDALRLRGWAIGNEGDRLSLKEIARHILNEEENPNSKR